MCTKFKVIIAGGRDFDNYSLLFAKMFLYLDNKKTTEVEVVSGGAKGADSLGERFATEVSVKIIKFPADWDSNGKAAGYIRNKEMSKYANALVAFWDGKSKGTKNMIDLAKKEELQIRVVYY